LIFLFIVEIENKFNFFLPDALLNVG